MKTAKDFLYSNGDEVKDKITGFKGTITGTCFYITGCSQYLVVAQTKDEFSESKSKWVDEGRLTLLADQVVTIDEVEADENGCDMEAPNRG